MINHFPTPLPDELFYSMCARYGDRVRYPDIEAVNNELFGAKGMSAGVDLPSHLGRFAESLPPRHELTVRRIIEEHTLFPFYGPFLPVKRYERVCGDMEGSDGSAIHKCAGITPSNVRLHNWLRYCPVCVAEDRRAPNRCCYWHRLHQVPGVEVCPRHEVFLENSSVRARNRVNNALYVSAECAIPPTNARPLDPRDEVHQGLLGVARDAVWLLDQPGLNPGYDLLNVHYLKILSRKGLANGSYVYPRELLRTMNAYTPRPLLETLQCAFNPTKPHAWPAIINKNIRQGKTHHPLRHLLLIRLVGLTAELFFTSLSARPRASALAPESAGERSWPRMARMNSVVQETTPHDQVKRSREVDAKLLEAKRGEWLEAIRKNPDANRTRLQREIAPRVYAWLLYHDNDWLKASMPPPFKRTKSAREIVDWNSRDSSLEKEVREAAGRLKQAEGKPVQVTVTAIARDINRKELLQKKNHLSKLPLTQQALEDVAEPRTGFALRRLRWAAGCFRSEGLAPAKSTLALRTCVGYEIWSDEGMAAALDAEWRYLHELPDLTNSTRKRTGEKVA
ncbi:MAG TPA: TnsD family Tn7-like transposition protein [Pyrinomonadaceae bacterium]|nr:TnsD family Tn7-like transposition protein [Pyrinomonadaceae bacterium]